MVLKRSQLLWKFLRTFFKLPDIGALHLKKTGINSNPRIRLICGQIQSLRLTLERHEVITERKRDFVKFKQFGVGLYQVGNLSALPR
jgi:hypothetical protein